MKGTHTPTPWMFQPKNFILGDVHDDEAAIIGTVDFGETDADAAVGEANARFIVRAVNSHEALVDALQSLEPYLSTEAQMLDAASLNEGRASGFDAASVKARKALALAKKGSTE